LKAKYRKQKAPFRWQAGGRKEKLTGKLLSYKNNTIVEKYCQSEEEIYEEIIGRGFNSNNGGLARCLRG